MYKWLIVFEGFEKFASHNYMNVVIGKVVFIPNRVLGDERFGQNARADIEVLLFENFYW